MKKILFVINSLGLGGAEKSLTSLLSTFDFSRYSVDLLMFRPEGMFMKLLPDDVNILDAPAFLRSNGSLKSQITKPGYLSARLSASAAIRINSKSKKLHPAQCYWKHTHKCFDALPARYDTAIAWGQGNPTHFVAEKVSAVKKIAVINVNYESAGHNKDFDYPFYEKYDNILTVSDDLNKLTRDVFPQFRERIGTLYDITNADLVKKMAKESDPFSNETGKLKLATVGRLMPQKGYDLAVEAARLLKEKGCDFKWFFVGDGSVRAEIEQKITDCGLEKQVTVTGAKDNPYVYMNYCDIYVQTSRFEGYCLTLSEARILNKPIVSTDFDVVHDQLTDGVNGLIVEMNGTSISEAIIRLSKDKDLQETLSGNLRKEKKGNVEEIEKLYAIIEGRE